MYCVDGSCNPMASGTSGSGGNCSTACEVFLACTTDALANRSEWKVGRNLYNKSLAMRARAHCLGIPEAVECLNIKKPDVDPCVGRKSTVDAPCGEEPISLSNPKSAGCLDLGCYFCGQVLWSKYFTCAIDCGGVNDASICPACAHAAHMCCQPVHPPPPVPPLPQNMTHPSIECSDCSFNFEDMYEQIDLLRYTLWQAYFVGAMGKTGCSEILCPFTHTGLLDASEPMSEDCRRCHYPMEDFINTDHEACLHGDEFRCVTLTRGINNYMQDVFAPDLEGGKAGAVSNATNVESTAEV